MNFWLRSPFLTQAESLMFFQIFCDGTLIVTDISEDTRVYGAGVYTGGRGGAVYAGSQPL